jgi:hypothetical protein
LLSLVLAQAVPAPAIGTWSGTLEYRDYRSDRRVTLPTTLVVTAAADGALEYVYTYDDGPGKTVVTRERVTINADAGTYRIQNAASNYDATFVGAGLRDFVSRGNTVVLTGTGTENDVPVELRITIEATASALTMLRESRRPGGEWLFRNRYAFTR